MHNWHLLLFVYLAILRGTASFSERSFVDGQQQCCEQRAQSTTRLSSYGIVLGKPDSEFRIIDANQRDRADVSRENRIRHNKNTRSNERRFLQENRSTPRITRFVIANRGNQIANFERRHDQTLLPSSINVRRSGPNVFRREVDRRTDLLKQRSRDDFRLTTRTSERQLLQNTFSRSLEKGEIRSNEIRLQKRIRGSSSEDSIRSEFKRTLQKEQDVIKSNMNRQDFNTRNLRSSDIGRQVDHIDQRDSFRPHSLDSRRESDRRLLQRDLRTPRDSERRLLTNKSSLQRFQISNEIKRSRIVDMHQRSVNERAVLRDTINENNRLKERNTLRSRNLNVRSMKIGRDENSDESRRFAESNERTRLNCETERANRRSQVSNDRDVTNTRNTDTRLERVTRNRISELNARLVRSYERNNNYNSLRAREEVSRSSKRADGHQTRIYSNEEFTKEGELRTHSMSPFKLRISHERDSVGSQRLDSKVTSLERDERRIQDISQRRSTDNSKSLMERVSPDMSVRFTRDVSKIRSMETRNTVLSTRLADANGRQQDKGTRNVEYIIRSTSDRQRVGNNINLARSRNSDARDLHRYTDERRIRQESSHSRRINREVDTYSNVERHRLSNEKRRDRSISRELNSMTLDLMPDSKDTKMTDRNESNNLRKLSKTRVELNRNGDIRDQRLINRAVITKNNKYEARDLRTQSELRNYRTDNVAERRFASTLRINDDRQKGEKPNMPYVSENWQIFLFYTLQGIYLCSMLIQIFNNKVDKKIKRNSAWWTPTTKLLKVE